MNFVPPLSSLRIVWLAAAIIAGSCSSALAQAPAAVVPMDVQDTTNAANLATQGKYEEAAKLYEGIPTKYPTSPLIPESFLRLGYVCFSAGQHDRAIGALRKSLTAKNVTPLIVELANSLIPQVMAAKALKLPETDPSRKTAIQDALLEFDAFISKYPQSEEVEAIFNSKARILYGLQRYEEATATMRTAMAKFANSASNLDTQFMFALTLCGQGNAALQKAETKNAAADAAYDEASKVLGDIIRKNTDLALSNDAQFQLGEILAARSSFEKDEARAAMLKNALAAYRAVLSKDMVLKNQQARIGYIKQALENAVKNQNFPERDRIQRILSKEQDKTAGLETRPDQMLPAKLKAAQIYLNMEKYNEVRVIMRFIDDLVTEADAKKQVAYMITLTYAVQNNTEKAVPLYDKFFATYKADPVAENLPLLMGAAFLNKNESDAAMKYFKQQSELYPNSKLNGDAVMRQALALIPLERYDEALAVLTKFTAGNPTREQGATAELGIATIYQKTGKRDEALASFIRLRDKYAGTVEAEQAAYWAGQLTLNGGDAKAAVTEIQKFVSTYPSSEMMPAGLLILGQAQAASDAKEAALKTFKELAEKFAQSEPAPISYFQRAALHQRDNDLQNVKAVMKEFIAAYPDNSRLFAAYDYIAQILVTEKALPEAIATYEEFIKKKPTEADNSKSQLKISGLWRKYGEDQGLYLNLNETQRVEWRKGLDNAIAAAEQVLEKYPASPEVALAIQALMICQKQFVSAKLKTDKELENYFQTLAKNFSNKADIQNKILFSLAGYLWDKAQNNPFMEDKSRDLMAKAYDPSLVYAPADIDLYGAALLRKKDWAKIQQLADKLAGDFPLPAGMAADKAPTLIKDAQSIVLFLSAKALQGQNKTAESAAKFTELKANYPSSNKGLEANYGIAEGEFEKQEYESALSALSEVAKAPSAPSNLRARAMMLIAKIKEATGEYDAAINNYIKLGTLFPAEQELAPDGLWRGAQLIEKKISGAIVVKPPATPTPAAKPGDKAAEKTGEKPADKPVDKPADKAGVKPGVKPAATPKK